jgi:hypothetical protein
MPPYVVGQRLSIGEKEKLLGLVLKLNAGSQGADVMAEVKRTGGPVAGQDSGSIG